VTDDERCAMIDQAFATLERLDRRLPRPLSGPSVIRRPHQELPQGRRGPSDAEIEQLRGGEWGCMGKICSRTYLGIEKVRLRLVAGARFVQGRTSTELRKFV
jgi:hypothetical protein